MGSPVVAASPRKSPLSGRRINKPLVEKKRRARINGCLGQLKSLILNAMETEQGAQVSRLEKADILEMTVKYLRQIQRQQVTVAVTSEPDVVAKFSAGYTECASEVIRYMESVHCVAPEVKSRLEFHLVERLKESVPATSICDGNPLTSFNMTSENLAQVNETYSRYISSTSVKSEEINRHYQTALDLANMAADVTAKEVVSTPTVAVTTAAFHPPQPPLSSARSTSAMSPLKVISSCLPRTKAVDNSSQLMPAARICTSSESIYNANIRCSEPSVMVVSSTASVYACGDLRQRHTSVETAVSHLANSSSTRVATELNGVTGSDVNNNQTIDIRSKQQQHATSSISNYLSSFQHPLHIHIPHTPPPAPSPTTPSPPCLHPHMAYPHMAYPHELLPAPGLATTHTFDAPPTILYGCETYPTPLHNNTMSEPSEELICRSTDEHTNELNINQSQYYCNNFINCNSDSNSSNRSYFDGSEAAVNTRFSNIHKENIDNNCQSHFQSQQILTSRRVRSTPSPPTLVLEQPYITPENDRHHSNNRYHNLSNAEQPTFVKCRAKLPPNLPSNYDERLTGNNYINSPEFEHPTCQYEQYSSYPYHPNNPPNVKTIHTTRECPAEQPPRSAPVNNGQHRLSGPGLPPRAPSRQKDISLSPPTLKKRLLLAQGSEGDRTTPRGNELNPDKRLKHDAELGLSKCGQNPPFWRDSHERYLHLNHKTNSSGPAVIFCTVPAHVVSADDGLWRPW